MSEWLKLVKRVYREGKASGMSYKQAMQKAKGIYRKKDGKRDAKKKTKKQK